MTLLRRAAIVLALLGLGVGTFAITHSEPRLPGRIWTPAMTASGERIQPDEASTAPGEGSEFVLSWWDDVDGCSAVRRESSFGRLLRTLARRAQPNSDYRGTPLILTDAAGTGWQELLRFDGEVQARPEDTEGVEGTWDHTRADGTTVTLRLLGDGTVDGNSWRARWATAKAVLVVCPASTLPTSSRKVRHLQSSPDWPHRFQATLADDRRSYVGTDGLGRSVHGHRKDAPDGR